MRIIHLIIQAAIPVFLVLASNAQFPDVPEVQTERMRQHVSFLASDSLRGRGMGTPELDATADYLTGQLQKMNLTSPCDGYLQEFMLKTTMRNMKNSGITIHNERGRKKYSTDSFIAYSQNADSIALEGELIFAGFGLSNSTSEANIGLLSELKDRIVIYSSGSPASFGNENAGSWNRNAERKKMNALIEAGAKALIATTSVHDSSNASFNRLKKIAERQAYSLEAGQQDQNPNIFIVTPKVADALTGRKFNWHQALRSVAENEKYDHSTIRHNRISIKSEQSVQNIDTRNVIGILEGSDPELKHECIVFIAHYDHLGTGSDGEIFNGADDNASGVATLLEIAGMFASLEEKPKRSLLFLFPTAEEIGLFGSDYYSRNPVFSMENTVACINLDMVGRVYEQRDSVWANSPKPVKDFNGIYALVNQFNPEIKDIAVDACDQLNLEPDFSLPDRFFYSSDHFHFHKNRVPILNLSTGYSTDYHKPTDTADRIRTDKMKLVAQLCYLVGMKLGNPE